MKGINITYDPFLETEVIEIIHAEYVDGFRIHLWFNDGKEHVVDFTPFLEKARNSALKKYRAVREFNKFKLVYGNLDWNDYEMCFPVADLHEGKI
ncbi:DUF2442 domain-containing protein [candidate division KSB1 bacterium]|nr:DUF2442 domain-containing protein [candidate division KSB1 bacterium]